MTARDSHPARLVGTAAVLATATQALSRFDLDLRGFTVSSVTVNGHRAAWSRAGQELRITPTGRCAGARRSWSRSGTPGCRR